MKKTAGNKCQSNEKIPRQKINDQIVLGIISSSISNKPYIIKENEIKRTNVDSFGSKEIINTMEVLNLNDLHVFIENNLGPSGRNKVYITIPSYIDHYQKQAILIAGKL